MQLSELIKVIAGEKYQMTEAEVDAVEFDSRRVRPGTLFIAMKGERFDGHDFVEAAIENGAVALVTERKVAANIPQVVVTDTRASLGKLAHQFYGGFADLTKVAITGTNGKTTTSFLIRSILETSGKRTGLIGTIYYIGKTRTKAVRTTPESLDIFRMINEFKTDGTEAIVMEVSSHGLALKRVDEMRFHVVVFTNLSQDHLDFHQTIDRYRAAKMRIFSLLNPDGCAVFNMDDATSHHIKQLGLKRTMTYGMENKSDVGAEITSDTADGLNLDISYQNHKYRVTSKLIGTYNAYNILAAFTAAVALGITRDAIVQGIAKITNIKGRMERVTDNIFIDYAHTPLAIENALSSLKRYAQGKLLVVFGCGGDRDKDKRPKMAAAATSLADFTIITTDNPRREPPGRIIENIVKGVTTEQYEVIEDRRTAIKQAITKKQAEDILLIAGKGHEDYQIIGNRVLKFDDAEVIRECTESL
ncbi:MAG: UDP-N-acetylmuramoyl-L-alanyl-D-glutamate--2,6-diaminopimelate ligase [bacterium]